MKAFTSILSGLAFALSSAPALSALSPFGCDGGITTVYTLSLEPAASAPVFANSVVCGPVEDARSTADGESINVASLDSDAGVTLGAGAAILGDGLSTQSFVQGGAIFDFIPRRMDGQSGLGEITYTARATLLEHTFTGQGQFDASIRNQASVVISEIDEDGNIVSVKSSERLIIGTIPAFGIDEFEEFGQSVQIVSGRRYIITLTGLVDIALTSRFDSDTFTYGKAFYSTSLGLSAQILAPAGWELEYPGGVQTTLGDYPPFNTPALVPLPGGLALVLAPLAGLGWRRRATRRRA